MDSLLQDLKFGARILWRSPGITIAVILALALGIGANSAMFSVVDALLLHPLRYGNPATLAVIWERDAQGVIWGASPANFLDWRKQAKSFTEIAGWAAAGFVRTGIDHPEQLTGAAVTENFFHTMGVKPALGRTFLPGEDGIAQPEAASKVVIISDRMWRQSFGADQNILGQQLKLNTSTYTIIGVMPPEFQFISRQHDLWTPISINPRNRDFHQITMVVARMAAPRETAAAEMAAIAKNLADAYPKSNKGWSVEVDGLQDWLINRTFKTRLLLLFAAVGMVLLIACTNVASLLLARSAIRNREIAVRLSVGATTGRLMRQLLTESVLLSLAGGVLGIALAWGLIVLAPKFVPPNAIPAAAPIQLNLSVALFTLAISVATGILFGLAPAITSANPDVQSTLKDSTRGSTGGSTLRRFRQVMAAAEIALALMLTASAVLMVESLRNLTDSDLGFDPKNSLTLRFLLPTAKYDAAHALAFHREALRRIAALPGVKGVAIGSNLPLQRPTMGVPFDLESSPPREQAERPGVSYVTISQGYFSTLGIAVKRGRAFTENDNETAPRVVIINEAFAARYFPNENPVGKRILLDPPKLPNGFEETIHPEIVGVVRSVKTSDLAAAPEPILYAPHAQNIWSGATWFTMRSAMDPSGLTAAVRRELLAMDREQPVNQIGSLDQVLFTRSAEPRFQTQLMTAFALLALLLAVVGIYSVTAYAVVQRKREIGVRMALGATQGMVLREVVAQGMTLTLIGIVLGLAGALGIASVLRSVLVGVSATDPATLAGVAALLAAVTAIACYFPARRASRIDPAAALRED